MTGGSTMSQVRWIPDVPPYNPKTPFMTRANAGEVLPAPPSPAAFDLTFGTGGSFSGWRDCAVNRLGVGNEELTPDEDYCDFIAVIGGYAYLGATWIRVWGRTHAGHVGSRHRSGLLR